MSYQQRVRNYPLKTLFRPPYRYPSYFCTCMIAFLNVRALKEYVGHAESKNLSPSILVALFLLHLQLTLYISTHHNRISVGIALLS